MFLSRFVFIQNTLSVHSVYISTLCCSYYNADSQYRRRRLAETNDNSSTLVVIQLISKQLSVCMQITLCPQRAPSDKMEGRC